MNEIRLIDANALFERIGQIKPKNKQQYEDIGLFMNMITNAPTVFACNACKNMGNESECIDCHDYSNYVHYEERPQGEWIPVSERLPDKNMPCLVSVGKFNFTQIAVYSNLMETIDHKIFYQGDYGKNNFQNITEYVNAWQPLPEPYKKGGAE